jgi:MFS family permease
MMTMSVTMREENGPYATWLGCLLLGFGLAWIAFVVVMVYVLTHPDPYDDQPLAPEPFVGIGFLALMLAAFAVSSAVLIRWRPKTFPMPTRLPKAALVSVLIGAALAGWVVSIAVFAWSPDGPDWRVVVCGLVSIAAALLVVILNILRRRFFRVEQGA